MSKEKCDFCPYHKKHGHCPTDSGTKDVNCEIARESLYSWQRMQREYSI